MGLNKYEAEIERLIKEHNGTLVRSKKHIIWRFPNGKSLTMSATPSDNLSTCKNQLTELRGVLGIEDPERGKAGERRPPTRKNPPIRPVRITPTIPGGLQEQLRRSGIVEESLRDEIDVLKIDRDRLYASLSREKELRERIEGLEAHIARCWVCRVRRIVKRWQGK